MELLIVIVVIGILAAITIVAYSGIQQRANNTATIAAVNQTVKAMTAYSALNNSYVGTGVYCIVTSTTCSEGGNPIPVNSTIQNSLKSVASLPTSVANTASGYNGIVYDYGGARTFNGQVQPAVLLYTLSGDAQPCGVANTTNSGGYVMVTGTYALSGSGYTVCVVSLQGPAS